MNVAGKTYIYDYVDLVWAEEITDQQKKEILEGQTEQEIKEGFAVAYENYKMIFNEDGSVIISVNRHTSVQYFTQSVNKTLVEIWQDSSHSQINATFRFVDKRLCNVSSDNLSQTQHSELTTYIFFKEGK